MASTPPFVPPEVGAKIKDVIGGARDTYNGLSSGVRSIVTMVVVIVLALILFRFVTSLIGRVIGAVVGVIVAFAVWHYLPAISANFPGGGKLQP